MSVVTQAARRSFRIVALPLTRPLPFKTTEKRLTYYNFTFPPANPPKTENESKWHYSNIGQTILGKAESVWTGFGQAKPGSWKVRLYDYGTKIQSRLDFEEQSLKAVDPTLGPTILHPGVDGKKHDHDPKLHIPLVFPSSIQTASEALETLRTVLAHRTPSHRRSFWIYFIIAPLTAPIALIPVIPNIPFFFCAWRAWSHYKAYRSSQYLESLLLQNAIVPSPSAELNEVYKQHSSKESETLLTSQAISPIVSILGLHANAAPEILRAIQQAEMRVNSGRGHL